MKLNPECIRDLLLEVEEHVTHFDMYRYDVETLPSNNRLAKYSANEVFYHAKQCSMSGLLLNVSFVTGETVCYIQDLSPAGHEFLANIRSDSVWNKTKERAKEIGAFSLRSLTDIASNVIATLISAHFSS